MKHTMKHKKMMITLAACAVVLAGIGGTYSVLTASTDTVKNTFKPEVIETEIEEDFSGGDFNKKVTVKNIGPDDAFIRARVTVSPEEVAEWKHSNSDGDDWDWVDGKDGWYYYPYVVPSGKSTTSLMTKVELKDANFEGDFDVTVYQEAVGTGQYTKDSGEVDVKEIKEFFEAIGKKDKK